MRQILLTRHGGPEAFELQDSASRLPEGHEIRIAVRAIGVNFADVLLRIGLYPNAPELPAVIGYEVAGEVDAVGDGVGGLPIGTRVVALTPAYGGYSESVLLGRDEVVPLPANIDFAAAAATPVNYLTAWLMLRKQAHLQTNESILVHGVAGGVGQAALQISQWLGAHVIGTASKHKHSRLREMGVEHCIDYRTEDFQRRVMEVTDGKGVDVVLDAVGGRSFSKSYECLSPLGRMCIFGVSGMVNGRRRRVWTIAKNLLQMPRFSPLRLLSDNRGVFGFSLGELGQKTDLRMDALAEIVSLVSEGALTPTVDSTFPLEDVSAAHDRLQSRRSFGKVLLIP